MAPAFRLATRHCVAAAASKSLAAPLLLAILLTQPAAAQLTGGGPTTPDGSRPKKTQVGIFELLRSSGNWAAAKLQAIGPSQPSDAEKWNGVGSPQEAVMTFVTAMDEVDRGRTEAWPRALRLFVDLDEDAARQAARHLKDVFDRLPELSSGSLPADDTVEQTGMRRWELFPRGIAREWAYTALDGGPNGAIVLTSDDGSEWRFDRATIDGASSLADSMRPIPPRGWTDENGTLFEQTVVPTFMETPWWGWLVLVASVAGGFAVAWGAGIAVHKAAKLLKDAGNEVVPPLLTGIITPLSAVAIAVGFLLGTAPLHLEPALDAYRWNISKFLLLVAGVWLLVAAVELSIYFLRRMFVSDHNPYARMATNVVQRIIRLAALAVLLVYVFRFVLNWNVTALVGGIGLLGLALSLAAKDAVANLFGAIMIFASRPFVIGDWIIFKDEIGQVDDVSVQMTKVRLLGGEMLAIPNQQFVDEPVENLSMRKWKRRVLNIQVVYDTPPEKLDQARELILETLCSDAVCRNNDCDLDAYPPQVAFDQFGPHYLNLRADYWYLMSDDDSDATASQMQRDTDRGYLSYLEHCGRVNRLLFETLTDAGVEFAFPTQTLKLERGEQPVALVQGEDDVG